MANDIDKTSTHYKGEFGSIYEVNQKFPSGGVEGDYVAIDGWAHYWNADRGTWCVNAQRDSYWDELITNIIEHFKTIKGATYMGVATTDTVPDTTAAKMFYFALQGGKYANFGNQDVAQGINVLLTEDGKSWTVQSLISVAQELGASTTMLMSQKAITDAINRKANTADVDEALAKKADKETVDTALGKKADKETVDAELAKKANAADVDTKFTEEKKRVDAELDKKANAADVDTKFTEEKKRVDGELDKKLDKESVVQESGEDEDKVMSQKAVSTKLSDLSKLITEIVSERDSLYHITQNENYLLAIVDKADNFLGGITKSGRWVIPDGISDEARKHVNIIYDVLKKLRADIDAEVGERTSIIRRGNSSYEWAIADKIGNVWIAGTKDGKVVIPSGIPDEVKPLLDDAFKRIERLERFIKTSDANGILAALVDANMNELLSVDKEGIFSILNKLKTQSGMSIETVDTMADSLYAILDRNRNVIINITKAGKLQLVNGITLDNINSGISIVDSDNWLFAIVDANRNVVGGFDKYGALFANSIKGVCSIERVENENWLFAVLDAAGNVMLGIRKDGSFFASSVVIEGIPTREESMTFLYAIIDRNRNVLWGIMKSGRVYQPKGIPEEVNVELDKIKRSLSSLASKEINNKFLDKVMLYGNTGRHFLGNVALQEPGTTDYCIIMMYGQSLSNGSETPAGFNDDVVEGCLMLGDNVWNTSGDTLQGLKVGGTVMSNGVATGTRQDAVVSTVNAFVSLYKKERPWDKNTKFIACSLGLGGRTVAQLSGYKFAEGQTSSLRYPMCNEKHLNTRVKPFFEAVKAIADREGKTISLSAVFWNQGEADYGQTYIGKTYDEWKVIQDTKENVDSNAMSGCKDAYKRGLTFLKEDIFALAKSIFGDAQANRPVFMPYSVCGGYIDNAYQTINNATYEMANEQDDVVQVGPTYVTPEYNGGHLSMNGYRWYGEYCAKALYYVYLKHMDFKPLQPEGFEVKGNKIYIYINPIVPPLRIDTYTQDAVYKNYGFSVRMGSITQLDEWKSMTSGGIQTITDVTISENCIILTCGNIEKFTEAVEVSYAGQGESGKSHHYQGAGNIRDSDNWQALYKYRNDSADHGNRISFAVWSSIRVATDSDRESYQVWNKDTIYNYGNMCIFSIDNIDYVLKSAKDGNKNIAPYSNGKWGSDYYWSGNAKATKEELETLHYWDENYATSTGYVNGDKVLFDVIEKDSPIVLTNTYADIAGTVVNKSRPFNPLNYHTTDVKGNTIVGKPYPMQNWLLNFYKRIIL